MGQYMIPDHFLNLVYTYRRIKSSLDELKKDKPNLYKIHWWMKDIELQMLQELNESFIDIEPKYLYHHAKALQYLTNAHMIKKMLMDMQKHMQYE